MCSLTPPPQKSLLHHFPSQEQAGQIYFSEQEPLAFLIVGQFAHDKWAHLKYLEEALYSKRESSWFEAACRMRQARTH